MKRLKLFWQLLTRQSPPDYLRNACRWKLVRAWRYSRMIDGVQVLSLAECSLCDGTGKAFGNTCPRCEGTGALEMLNPSIFEPTGGDRDV